MVGHVSLGYCISRRFFIPLFDNAVLIILDNQTKKANL